MRTIEYAKAPRGAYPMSATTATMTAVIVDTPISQPETEGAKMRANTAKSERTLARRDFNRRLMNTHGKPIASRSAPSQRKYSGFRFAGIPVNISFVRETRPSSGILYSWLFTVS
jgi:hypothetical protein